MTARTILVQANFSSLGLDVGQDAESRPAAHTAIERTESGNSIKSESACEADKIFQPVNFISDEVQEFIRNWELSYLRRQERAQSVESMDMAVSHSQSNENINYEPMRSLSTAAPPPKRFHRTVWRSLARRVIERQKADAIAK
jgi:hypothetical protein